MADYYRISLYIIIYHFQLVVGSRTDPELLRMTQEITWYIIPLANPDGYEHTWKQV